MAVASLLRNDVAAAELLRYVAYLVVAVLVPGILISRTLLGRRTHLVEDLAMGAVVGLAVQVLVWKVLRSFGLDGLLPWWWTAVLVLFAAVPQLRPHWWVRFGRPVGLGWSWAMAAVSCSVIARVDAQWLRVNPVPPEGGVAHVDAWWHLAIVREFLRPGPPQIPQVAGESMAYHANSHAHVAVSVVTSRVDAEVVFLRLWVIPIVLVGVALFALLAQEVSKRSWTGPLAAAMAFVLISGGYLWPGLSPLSANPIRVASPSQVFVLPFAFAAGWALIRLVRGELHRWGWLALVLLVVAGSGAKPTMVLILLGGTLLSILFLIVRERAIPRGPVLAGAGLVAVQVWSMSGGLDERGSSITLLGSLKSISIYRDITLDTTYRAVNDGLVLDSLTGTRAMTAAGATLVWFALVHAFQFVGLCSVFNRTSRRDPATWWLIGALATGVAVFFTLDHSAFSQAYFLHLSLPFGIVLTTSLISAVYVQIERPRALGLAAVGVGIGSLIAMTAAALTRSLTTIGTFGVLDRVAVPLLVVVVAGIGVGVVCWRHPAATVVSKRGASALALAAMIGIAVPTTVDTLSRQTVRWLRTPVQSVDQDDRGYLSADEHAAAVWLDENSAESDVVASNTQCRELTTNPRTCNAVGFWVSGVAGRRVVLEGWGYTAPAHAAHGENGLHRNRTPPGWPERYELSIAAIEDPTADVIDTLADEYGADWIFASRRAGPVSNRIADFATPAFDNGAVAIYQIDRSEKLDE